MFDILDADDCGPEKLCDDDILPYKGFRRTREQKMITRIDIGRTDNTHTRQVNLKKQAMKQSLMRDAGLDEPIDDIALDHCE